MATVRKHGNYWHAYIRKDGKEVGRSTGIPHLGGNRGKRKALEWAKAWEERESKPAATLYDYCMDYYRTKLEMGRIERSTMLAYESLLTYVRDYFGNRAVSEVDASDVQAFVGFLLLEQGYSHNTVKKTFNVLAQVFRHGVKTRELAWNPCDAVIPPSQTKMQPNPLTEESRRAFVASMSTLRLTPEVVAVWIAYYTGMRRGEICALRWDCVGNVISVRESIGIADGGTYRKGTKTGETRSVPVPDALREILARVPRSGPYVCGGESYLNPTMLTRWWGQHSKEWGLVGTQGKRPTLHDLRHTYATIAVRALDIKTAQSVMGHANAQMTMSYADTDDGHVLSAGSALSLAFC